MLGPRPTERSAVSSADVLGVYRELAERRLSPTPLVPSSVPPTGGLAGVQRAEHDA